jgi:ribosome biogenesis protein ERB1
MVKSKKNKANTSKKTLPEKTLESSPVDSESDQDESEGESQSEASVYDSADEYYDQGNGEEDGSESEGSEDEFEDQGSSDEDEEILERQRKHDDGDDLELDLQENMEAAYEKPPRQFSTRKKKTASGSMKNNPSGPEKKEGPDTAEWMHTDNLSSDDEAEEGTGNRIGRVPLHWYDDYDHMGYDAHGNKVVKSTSAQNGDLLDQAIAHSDQLEKGNFVIHDALNDRNVPLSARQLELIRRVQAGAFAHPEFDGTPDYVDYYSGIPEISGINSNRTEPKARFQPSQWKNCKWIASWRS